MGVIACVCARQSFERLPVPDEVYFAATVEAKIDYQRACDGVGESSLPCRVASVI